MGWSGIGTLIGKLADFIPGRKEARRNKEDKLEREYEEILKKPSTVASIKRLQRIAKQLRIIKQKNKNG